MKSWAQKRIIAQVLNMSNALVKSYRLALVQTLSCFGRSKSTANCRMASLRDRWGAYPYIGVVAEDQAEV